MDIGTTYWTLERECEEAFRQGGPFWHICTDGNYQKTVFSNDTDYIIVMNCIAYCVLESGIRLIAFVIMNNHIHLIVECSECEAHHFFKLLKLRLLRCMGHRNKSSLLTDFDCGKPIAIPTLQSLRNEIAYVHRNPFVARQDILPHGYLWGSGCIYFNNRIIPRNAKNHSKLTYREKRALHTSTNQPVPDSFIVGNGYILPESYIDVKRCEKFFRHASHYYYCLTRNIEAFSEVSKKLGDTVFLNDEEIISAANLVARTLFGVDRANLLVGDQNRQVAIELHNKYKAGNKQIARVLKLTIDQVNQLFPPQR